MWPISVLTANDSKSFLGENDIYFIICVHNTKCTILMDSLQCYSNQNNVLYTRNICIRTFNFKWGVENINSFYSENDLTDNKTILNVSSTLYQRLRITIKNLICLVYYIPFLKPKCLTEHKNIARLCIYTMGKDRPFTMITSLFVVLMF